MGEGVQQGNFEGGGGKRLRTTVLDEKGKIVLIFILSSMEEKYIKE